MGNPQHLEWLLEGVGAWNARRKAEVFDPDFRDVDIREAFTKAGKLGVLDRIPLGGANLRGADLRRADLRWADLREAVLVGADLEGAVLVVANLGGADLEGADLGGANLGGADLRGAVLERADLRGAKLGGADLRRAVLVVANLGGAVLEGADLGGAVLREADLREADLRGADLGAVYLGAGANDLGTPKYTDLRAVRHLSQEELNGAMGDRGVLLPEGLGYPEHWPLPPHLVEEGSGAPQRNPFVFLSYSRDDEIRIGAVHGMLQGAALPLWWDQDVAGGEGWRDAIKSQLEAAAVVLTVWTEASVLSDAVREEASTAQAHGKLVHVRLDDVDLPYGYGETQWIDLRTWDGTASDPNFLKLVQSLKDKIDPPDAGEVFARLRAGSPVDAKRDAGRLRLFDTPVNTPPAQDDPVEKGERLRGLWQSVARVQEVVAGETQVPPRMKTEVSVFAKLQEHEELSWFALDDGSDALRAVLSEYRDPEDGLPSLFADITRLVARAQELEPFMRPLQPAPDAPDAKPVQTEPIVRRNELPDVTARMPDLQDALESDAARAVLDDDSRDYLLEAAHETAAAAKDGVGISDEARFWRVRNGVKKLIYGLGAITAAIGGGVMVNLLTAKEAATVLAARLQLVVDWLLKFF